MKRGSFTGESPSRKRGWTAAAESWMAVGLCLRDIRALRGLLCFGDTHDPKRFRTEATKPTEWQERTKALELRVLRASHGLGRLADPCRGRTPLHPGSARQRCWSAPVLWSFGKPVWLGLALLQKDRALPGGCAKAAQKRRTPKRCARPAACEARPPHLRSSISHLPRRRRRCHQSSLPPSRVRTLPVM
jgi:hypothetical protein